MAKAGNKIVDIALITIPTKGSSIKPLEKSAKSGKVKISSIQDYTSDKVNIEIRLQRGVYTKDVVDALYAFTECEQTIYCNLLVIKENMPVQMTCTQVIEYHSKQLVGILKAELELEKSDLIDKLHLRTLERIFIEERIYKKIEQEKTEEAVNKAVLKGFVPFKEELIRPITQDDIDHLLRIPIRRISLYDINKNRQEVTAINNRIKEINKLLKHIVEYAISYLDGIEKKLDGETTKRHTTITNINAVDVKTVTKRDLPLKYDAKSGNLGIEVSGGQELFKVTPYDKILFVRKSGIFSVCETPKKLFVGPQLRHCGFADKESLSKVLFTILYRDPETQFVYIKRCKIQAFIMNRDYFFAPDGMEVLHVDTRKNFSFQLNYVKKPRVKVLSEKFKAEDYEEKSLKAKGVRVVAKEVQDIVVQE